MRLLIADNDDDVSSALCRHLEAGHYIVDTVSNGEEALNMIRSGIYEAVILDLMMPVTEGLYILKSMRDERIETPVLVASAKCGLEDRILGLEMGADDYIPKPFDLKEVAARVKALTRRKTVLIGDTPVFAGLSLNRELCQLEYDGRSVHLSSREYQIMELLLRSPDSLIPGVEILRKIWGFDSEADMNIVCVYVTYLRRKLKNMEVPIRIQSVRGIGYKLKCTAD